ncbi:pyruvate dehydrogenase E2 component (dihydrolipoamide acetyltransferase) [Poseidonocella sedimentorum]|uniref:Pyruvate dehydrogenase E2 component (Dihydrolipoamide acetyltransferase) n=1 Tax=Poseidonocella sedimentorum TaxID=871652 RepID=A0A1I6CSG6_9RHOB|nr:pyruvate dehydrogenase E2 component (dihydrolipoamide acetyltransferase) [Poseidonocella sedimentorum]
MRKLAAERGVDLDALARRLGRESIAREDVLAGAGQNAGQNAGQGDAPAERQSPRDEGAAWWAEEHAGFGPVREEPLDRMAQVGAARLGAAQRLIPSVTHHESADVTRLEAARTDAKARGGKVTALAVHVAVLVRCLREFPRFNASLSPDGARLILKEFVHVGIAVDTGRGLVVPVIRDADRKPVRALSAEIADLAARARGRRIRPAEMGGASMTISNLGGIGGESFTPIVNPPELAILGISRAEVRPHWDGAAFVPRKMVPLDLSYDHRVINGADAARFLARYAALLRDPDRLLL